MITLKNTFFFLLILFLSTVVLDGCKKSVEPEEDHAEAEGLVLRMNGVDIVTVREGQVTGEITVKAGTETDHINVFFLDEHGDRFQPDDPEKDLDWGIADATVADIERDAGEKWEIHVKGLKAGDTTVEIRLLHAGHADFRTPPIPIRVTP